MTRKVNMKNINKKLYYSTLTIAVAFWGLIALGALRDISVSALNEPPSPSGSFKVCGLEVSKASENFDEGSGTYTIDFTVKNTTNLKQELLAKRFSCRCPQADGMNSRDLGLDFDWSVCVGDWPNPLYDASHPGDGEKNCQFEEEIVNLNPGQEINRRVTVKTEGDVVDPSCGSFQADWFLRRVTSEEGVMCVADEDPAVPTHQGVKIPAAYGVFFTGKEMDGLDCRLKSDLKPPVCDLKMVPDPARGDIPFSVQFDARGSSDPDGTIQKYEWRVDGDLVPNLASQYAHTFEEVGQHGVTVRVQDNDEQWSELCLVVADAEEPEPEPVVCDIRSQSCELLADVPVQYRSGACSTVGDDAVCVEGAGPQFM